MLLWDLNMTPEAALAWAKARKKDTETVMIASCPCCKELLAIYIDQSARQEIVPGTTPANPEVGYATRCIDRSFE